MGASTMTTPRASFLALLGLLALTAPSPAAVPYEDKAKAELIGSPTELIVQPAAITLAGPRSRAQLVVSGKYADSAQRDLTCVCDFSCDDKALVSSAEGGYLEPKKNGSSSITIKAGGKSIKVPVVVKDVEKEQLVSFKNEFIAALNVGGCNAGACH